MNSRCVLALWLVAAMVTNTRADYADDPVKAAAVGRELAQQLVAARPEASFTNTGKLFIRASRKNRWQVDYTCRVVTTPSSWTSYYSAVRGTNALPGFSVEHRDGEANLYRDASGKPLGAEKLYTSFAGSDFWLADLGLEFFHWPEQRVLRWEMKRSCGCKVLESKNPNPTAGAYARVVSWIHDKSGGIVQAEAYDSAGKLLKEFRPTELQKVDGRQELKEMEIENVRTDSITRLEFDL